MSQTQDACKILYGVTVGVEGSDGELIGELEARSAHMFPGFVLLCMEDERVALPWRIIQGVHSDAE